MRLARVIAITCLILPGAARAGTAAGGITVRNLMPQFWNFWQAAQGKPADVQLQLWRRLYEQPNAPVFADLRGACAKDWADDVAKTEYLPLLAGLASGMRALSASLPLTIAGVHARFMGAFPDMRWTGPIYIMASGGCFNGRSQIIQGRQALLLAVDEIVALKETNLSPLISHEMFHRYHYAYFAFEPEQAEALWVRLWAEGMATYVAHELNPTASNLDLMTIAPQEVAQLNARLPGISRDFISRLEATSQADATLYFFDGSQSALIPPRAGYYLGFRVAAYLGRRYSMQTMAHWNHEQARPHIVAALSHLQQLH